MTDLVTFGEVLWDVIDGDAHIGGAPFNLAAHAVRCGLSAAVVSSVGDDTLGQSALAKMQQLGVANRWTTLNQTHPTGTVTVTLKGGQPSYTIHEGVAWDYIRLEPEAFQALVSEQPRAFCFGTLAQRNTVSQQTLKELLEAFKDAEIFYDVNLRQHFWSLPLIDAGLARATLVKVNDEEARMLGEGLFDGACDPDTFANALLARYPAHVVIVTLGADGCLVCARGQRSIRCPGMKVNVVDAVGAGDAFSAAFLASWLEGASAAEAAEAGNRRGAWVTSQRGAVPAEEE